MNKFDCCEFELKIKYQIPIEINGKKTVWDVNEDTYNKIKQILSCHNNGKLIAVKQENENMILSV